MQHEIFQKPVFETLLRLHEKIIDAKESAKRAHSAHAELQQGISDSSSENLTTALETALAKDTIAVTHSVHFDLFIARVVFQAIEYNSMKKSANEDVKKQLPNLRNDSPWYSNTLVWYFELALVQFDEVLSLCNCENFMDIKNDLVRLELVDMFLTSKCNADLDKVCLFKCALRINN